MLMRTFVPIARWLLILLAAAGVVITVIPEVPGNIWWVRYLDFPRLEILIACAAVWLLLLLVSRGAISRIALLVLAGAIACQASLLYPYTGFAPPNQIATETCAPGNRLRLLEVNVQMTNEHDNRLLNMVRQIDPDVAWFRKSTNGGCRIWRRWRRRCRTTSHKPSRTASALRCTRAILWPTRRSIFWRGRAIPRSSPGSGSPPISRSVSTRSIRARRRRARAPPNATLRSWPSR